ncbi:acetate--CoA ligase family protein [Desulfococcus sp.]|uniref:acetate--CoA ligase family protein n=1 Tax=Desulfococcus sp. TaxID=2025834 RepID=UPI003593BF31
MSPQPPLEKGIRVPESIPVRIDFEAITQLFTQARAQGRDFLFEHETYALLNHSGAETPPRTHLLAKGSRPADEELTAMPGDRVVLKIVSPAIIHKTEVGGVRVVEKHPDNIRSAWRRMMVEVPENYASMIERRSIHAPEIYRGLFGEALQQAVARDIQGVLMVQFMPPDSQAFGNEMIVGIRNTREFGMILSAGLGGTDTELYAERFRKGQAIVAASTALTDGEAFFALFRKTICYRKLAGLTRGRRRIVTDEQLIECFASFIAMANRYSPVNPEAPFIIEELEINPFAFTDYLMVPLDGMCRFARPGSMPAARPFHKIGTLLRPETIGIVGVSTSRINFGRVILNNILAGGFDPANIRIIRPGMADFEGIRCVPDLASLDVKLDLFVVAVGAHKVPELVDQVIAARAAETVMLIAGGMGETEESADRARKLMDRIRHAHAAEDGGPVFLGANCLGVVSHPGKYDTLFIPEAKLPKRRGDHTRNAAFVSQSGAFMITRLSKRPELDPAYMISVGNQNDLTLGDMLCHLKDDPAIDVIAVYAEGFKDLDGLAFTRAVREAVGSGKELVFYKAGRTQEGKSATSGHTASLAGDYMVCESCVRQAGGIVAQNFSQFEDLLMLAQRFHGKRINGNRLAALSGAGFEAVGMADNIQSDDYTLRMARLDAATVDKIAVMLREKGLDALVQVKNPLDINPGADDEAHVAAVRHLAEDPHVDAVVVGLDPLSPAMRTLAECESGRYNFDDPGSIAAEMPRLAAALEKPVVGVVDAGRLYDPLVERLSAGGMAVFRSSDRAVRALAMYIEGRLYAETLRH